MGALIPSRTRWCGRPDTVMVTDRVPLAALKQPFTQATSNDLLAYVVPRDEVDVPSFNVFHSSLKSSNMVI